jgi:hypothetical protein
MRESRWTISVCLILGAVGGGCSTSNNGTGTPPEAGLDSAPEASPPDSSSDAPEPEAGAADASDGGPIDAACAGVFCNGVCLPDNDCRACPGLPLLCAATKTCGATCSACVEANDAASPIGCFACDSTGLNPLGTCQPDEPTTYCLSGDYFKAYIDGSPGFHCACADGDAAACPGTNQVCVLAGSQPQCISCGELTTAETDGAVCGNGMSCSPGDHRCN